MNITELIQQEKERQSWNINLIASENYPSDNVLAALASPFGNKYAEGYPGRRYYNGCSIVDNLESYCCDLACELFGAEHANVQPLSGAMANLEVYTALLKPGDTILSLGMAGGGHLSHGAPANYVSKLYNIVNYELDDFAGRIYDCKPLDYTEDFSPTRKERVSYSYKPHYTFQWTADCPKPKLIIIGGSSVVSPIDYNFFRQMADQFDAYLMADIAHNAGPIAAGIIESPVPYADVVTGTTQKTLRGPRGGFILCRKEVSSVIDRAVFPGLQGGPHMNTIAAKGVAFEEALTPQFKDYQREVAYNTRNFVRTLDMNLGDDEGIFYAPESMPHMCLIDAAPYNSENHNGRVIADTLERLGIIVNANVMPSGEWSGIRVGFAAATTRHMRSRSKSEMHSPFPITELADIITDVILENADRWERNRIEWVTDYCIDL